MLSGRTRPRPRCIKFWSSRAPCATRAQHTNLEVQGVLPCFKKALREAWKQQHPGCTSRKTLCCSTGLLTLCLSSLCVRQLSHGLQAVRIEDPAPKRCLNTQFSSPPHTLPPSCSIQAASSTENLSLPAGEPGEEHHYQSSWNSLHTGNCIAPSAPTTQPHGSSLGSSQSMA